MQEVEDESETSAIPYIVYSFKKVADLESAAAGTIVDLVGVVTEVAQWQEITTRKGEQTQKRSITLQDDSGRSIEASARPSCLTERLNA